MTVMGDWKANGGVARLLVYRIKEHGNTSEKRRWPITRAFLTVAGVTDFQS